MYWPFWKAYNLHYFTLFYSPIIQNRIMHFLNNFCTSCTSSTVEVELFGCSYLSSSLRLVWSCLNSMLHFFTAESEGAVFLYIFNNLGYILKVTNNLLQKTSLLNVEIFLFLKVCKTLLLQKSIPSICIKNILYVHI